MYKFYAINVHTLIRGFWQLYKRFVDEYTLQKMNIYGSNYVEALQAEIPISNIEEKYGGLAQDMAAPFFPPVFV